MSAPDANVDKRGLAKLATNRPAVPPRRPIGEVAESLIADAGRAADMGDGKGAIVDQAPDRADADAQQTGCFGDGVEQGAGMGPGRADGEQLSERLTAALHGTSRRVRIPYEPAGYREVNRSVRAIPRVRESAGVT